MFRFLKELNFKSTGVTITPNDFWTDWCYSGHFGRFAEFCVEWCYSGHSGRFAEFRVEWCYSDHSGRRCSDRVV